MMRRPRVRWLWLAWCIGGPALAQSQAPPPALTNTIQLHAEKAGVRQVVRWRHAIVDLNGDNVPDALVLMLDREWCSSGGCTLLVLKGGPRGYTVMSSSGVTDVPIRVSPITLHGWKSLIVRTRGRGEVLLRFDGTRYPDNPALLPKATAGQVRGAAVVIE